MRAPRLLLLANWLLVAGFATWTLVRAGAEAGPLHPATLAYQAAHLLAFAAVVRRARTCPRERAAWTVVAAGIALYLAGDVYWSIALTHLDDPPFPSPADALYLGFAPCVYLGVVFLLRARFVGLQGRLLLDGVIATVATAAAGSAIVFPYVMSETGGDTLTVATNLAYPLLDIVLLAVVAGVFVLAGRRVGATWLLLGAGLVVFAVSDLIFLAQSARGTYVENTFLDVGWIAGTGLLALAAWQPSLPGSAERLGRWTLATVPGVAAVIVLGILTLDHYHRLDEAPILLSVACGALLLVRYVLALVDGTRMIATSREEAATDALTGLPNRRALTRDLEHALAWRQSGQELVFAIFDLDGFKAYNDRFGHPAGDALLARLAERLHAAVAADGQAYRLGGDELCVLLRGRGPRALAAARAALVEEHAGVRIAASGGAVRLPVEAGDVAQAMRIADARLYQDKASRAAAGLRNTTRDEESSRIVQMVYEALLTDRPFRRALEPAAALAELERNAGTLFDPDAVARFTATFRRDAA